MTKLWASRVVLGLGIVALLMEATGKQRPRIVAAEALSIVASALRVWQFEVEVRR